MRKGGKTGGKKKGYKAKHTLQAQSQREYVIREFENAIAPITEKAIKQAKKGDRFARDWLSNRSWGLPKQTTDVNMRQVIPYDDDAKDYGIQKDKDSEKEN